MKRTATWGFLPVLLLAVLLIGCQKQEDNQKHEIIAGVGISDLKVGDRVKTAFDLYGDVPVTYGKVGGVNTWLLMFSNEGIWLYCRDLVENEFSAEMAIDEIQLMWPYTGKTDRGIGIGSSKSEVLAAYGQPDTTDVLYGKHHYNLGLTFTYDENDSFVESIRIQR